MRRNKLMAPLLKVGRQLPELPGKFDESAAAARRNLMTSSHSPWPLFGNDLDQARSWIRPQLKGVVPMRTGHLAISIGLGAELMEAIQTGLLVAQTDAINQWRFRLARLYRERNPYVHLFSNKLHEQSLKILNKIKRSKGSLGVELNGGIGDHLEALSDVPGQNH